MEITVRTPQSKRRKYGIIRKDESDENYPCDLQFYKEPPSGNISLVEFQELGLERLKGNLFRRNKNKILLNFFSLYLFKNIFIISSFFSFTITRLGLHSGK